MSVALLIKGANADSPLVPVATEATYGAVWQAGANALELRWVEAMQFGIDVTDENRAEILEELRMLRGWFEASGYPSQSERLDLVVNALRNLRFDAGETASIG
jgi:hypothetical protein